MTTFFFYSFIEFITPPIFDNAIAIIVKKKKLYPYFDNGITTIRLSIFFFFLVTLGTPRTDNNKGGRGNSISPLPKFNIFSLHLFLLLSHTFG